MANQTRLLSGGTNYYLTSGGEYTGSGTPWTVATTSPYELGMNETAGQAWTPQAAPRQEVYGGGPPFRDGQTLIYDSYGNVTESITIQCRATSHDNAVALLRQLRQILNTALTTAPCILVVQPNGASNPVYFEIYGADVQEDARFINQESGAAAAGHALIRAIVTWRRSPFGGLLSSGETLINAQTFTVAGSTATLPTNLVAFSTGAGEQIYEGGPLNVKVVPTTASSTIGELWAGSVFSQVTATINSALSQYPSSPVSRSINIANALTRTGLKLRIIGRVQNTGGGAQTGYYAYIRGALASGGDFLYATPNLGAFPTLENVGLVDFGEINLDALRALSPLIGSLNVDYHATKYGGGTATLISTEILLYYDFCKISRVGADQSVSSYLWLNRFSERSGYACVPQAPSAATLTSSATPYALATVRGTLPRYFSGASLWANWVDSTGNNPTAATRAASVTVTHAPLYKTLRGAG